MGYPVVHFEVTGTDGERLKDYYSTLFGWKLNSDNPMAYGIVDGEDNPRVGGAPSIGGGVTQGPDGYPGHVTFYVAVPDVEATMVQAEQLGGTRVMGPETVMEGLTIGLFNDPEGHLIGVIEASAAE